MCKVGIMYVKRLTFSGIYDHLLKTITLIMLGCADINDGLSSYVSKENIIISQNMIVSQHSAIDATHTFPKVRFFNKENVVSTPNEDVERDGYNESASNSYTGQTSIRNSFVIKNITEAFEDEKEIEEIYRTPMFFGTENSTVITTQIGAVAHIPCTVHHIGDGVVSWIRKKDYHLLTVGLTTYSSDERFSATHLKHSEDWTLQIKFVQLRDAGIYECQVSTHPPTSIFLHLNVIEARADISGPTIRYLTPGSTLRLLCRVLQNTESTEFIFWYHDNRMINYDIDRGINVSTEADFQSSELTISQTRREHSGNYTCVASNAQPDSVLVHIFKGDNPAAMYHGHIGSSTKSYHNRNLACFMLAFLLGDLMFLFHVIRI